VDEHVRAQMKDILREIQSGDFAREWIAENRAGQEHFRALREQQARTQVEDVGRELRSHMDWIKPSF
jgi:ketol-acid reductoisomerase